MPHRDGPRDEGRGQRDFEFYSGKSVTVVYPSSPGAFPVEDVGQMIGEYLSCMVNVEYVTDNGTVGGTNRGAAAANDGLTIGITSIGGSLAAILTGPNQYSFDFQDLLFLGAVGNSPSVLVSSREDVRSVDQIVGRHESLSFVAFPNSRQLISSEMVATMFGLSATMLTGYPSSGAAAAGCQRGDGDLAVIALDQILNADNSAVAPGFTPLLRMGDVPEASKAYQLSLAIPSITDYLEQHPLTSDAARQAQTVNYNFSDSSVPAVAFFLPPGTPHARYLAVAAALEHAFRDPSLAQNLANKTVSSTLISPEAIRHWLSSTIETHGPFIQKIAANY